MLKKITIGNNRATYHNLMREFKALIQWKKRKYNFAIALNVKYLHERDPQGYWRFWKRHNTSRQTYDVLDAETFTEYYKNLENKPDYAFFDKQFMKNIDKFMSQYDGKTYLNTNNVLDDILKAPIRIDEIKLSLKRMKANKAAGVRRYFDPHDILTPGIYIRYFDLPNNNQWQSFIFLLYLLDRICHLIRIILMNF